MPRGVARTTTILCATGPQATGGPPTMQPATFRDQGGNRHCRVRSDPQSIPTRALTALLLDQSYSTAKPPFCLKVPTNGHGDFAKTSPRPPPPAPCACDHVDGGPSTPADPFAGLSCPRTPSVRNWAWIGCAQYTHQDPDCLPRDQFAALEIQSILALQCRA